MTLHHLAIADAPRRDRPGRGQRRRRRRPPRRGITAALAMIFMVLIAAMAIGFYATVTTSTSVAQNDQKGSRALMAAESGVQFMRFRLAHVTIPPTASTATAVITELHNDLKVDAAIVGNLGTRTAGLANNVITIPAEANEVILTDTSSNSGFRTVIESASSGGGIVCKVIGYSGSGRNRRSKTVSLNFIRQELPSTLLQNAIAAKGTVNVMKGVIGGVPLVSPDSIAGIMSAKTSSPAFTMTGGTVGGEIGVVDKAYASVTGGSVAGQTNLTTIHDNHVDVVQPPEFPLVDTTGFAAYATNTYTSSTSILQNVRIPANTNPKFSGGVAVQGILYVESPNQVEFGGNASLAGFIVFENKGTSATNSIKFGGNATFGPLPPDPIFNPLRSITGIAIMAPSASVTTTGSTDSYFKGNVIVGQFNELGSATIKMDQGSIVAMDTGTAATFNGQNTRFLSTGNLNPPSMGVKYTAKFIPHDGTYREIN